MKKLTSFSISKLVTTISLLILVLFFGQCTKSSQGGNAEIDDQNQTKSNTSNMLYKLYIVKTIGDADKSRGIELFAEFNKIYKDNNVKVIGVWLNSDVANEVYFMTAFQDASHYKSFVESMKGNQKYQEMSREMEAERDSVKAVNLKMAVSL